MLGDATSAESLFYAGFYVLYVKYHDFYAVLQLLLRRDAPEVAEALERGEIKSARAAAIEAGIITPLPSLQLKDPDSTAQKLLTKKGQAWCLLLLEELSALIL